MIGAVSFVFKGFPREWVLPGNGLSVVLKVSQFLRRGNSGFGKLLRGVWYLTPSVQHDAAPPLEVHDSCLLAPRLGAIPGALRDKAVAFVLSRNLLLHFLSERSSVFYVAVQTRRGFLINMCLLLFIRSRALPLQVKGSMMFNDDFLEEEYTNLPPYDDTEMLPVRDRPPSNGVARIICQMETGGDVRLSVCVAAAEKVVH